MIHHTSPIRFGAVYLESSLSPDRVAELKDASTLSLDELDKLPRNQTVRRPIDFTAHGDYFAKRCAEEYAEAQAANPDLTLEQFIDDTFIPTPRYAQSGGTALATFQQQKEGQKISLLKAIFNIKKSGTRDVLKAARQLQDDIRESGFSIPGHLRNLGVRIWATDEHARLLREAYEGSFEASTSGAANLERGRSIEEDFLAALKDSPEETIGRYLAEKPEAEREKIAAAIDDFAAATAADEDLTFPQYLLTLPQEKQREVAAVFEGINDALLANLGNDFQEPSGPPTVAAHDRVANLKSKLAERAV